MSVFYKLGLFIFLFMTSLHAEEEAPIEPVAISVISEHPGLVPHSSTWLGIEFAISPGWHIYWKNPGSAGLPPSFNWTLPPGMSIGNILWPYPKILNLEGDAVGFGYCDQTTFLVPLTLEGETIGDSVNIKFEVDLVACSDEMCLPINQEVNLELPFLNSQTLSSEEVLKKFQEARKAIPQVSWHVTASKRDALLFVEMSSSDASLELAGIQFFPKLEGDIGFQKGEVISREVSDSESFSRYQLSLKAPSGNRLNGILVLEMKDGTQKPLEVDIPLVETQPSNVIGMADSELPSKQSLKALRIEASPKAGSFWMALILALAGGLLLNLMPCVLPVISLKVISFVKLAGQGRSKIFLHALVFTGGVLVSFWVLAGLLFAFQAYGETVGWGFQLQEPLFVAALASLLFLMSLSLFGVFEIGVFFASRAGAMHNPSVRGLWASFGSGVLATAVATPCSGPFLGTAIGLAMTLAPWQGFAIFTFLGIGMALPYLFLALFPSFLKFVPKPGPWMITFKQLMAFILLATVIWLIWVFGAETSSASIILLLGTLFMFAIGAWGLGRWGTPFVQAWKRKLSYGLAGICFLAGSYNLYIATEVHASLQESEIVSNSIWEPFDPERLAQLRAQGIPVMIDFTAKWCITCQANHLALSAPSIIEQYRSKGIVTMKADWTRRDRSITEALKAFGRNSVPLYVLYGRGVDAEPVLLPQLLTSEIVLDYLKSIPLES